MIDGKLVWLQAEDPNEDISIALIIWGQLFISVLFKDILCKGNVSCTSYSRTFYDTQMATANCVHPHAQLEHA